MLLPTRVAGSGWTFSWVTTADVSGWSNLVAVIRDNDYQAANVLLTSETGSPTISTAGTTFSAGGGTVVLKVTPTNSATLDPLTVATRTVWLEMYATIAGVKQCVFPAVSFVVRSAVAFP